ncbi:MAG TPA: thioredoxin-disulfide reductase [Thermoleophilia bacterium]|nr:thioredoxin-disulfide reductase [Thermoleophilia bacterium]HQG03358.1 thioredoxin-disulfide reductase [Thermoleophilia bacterium]
MGLDIRIDLPRTEQSDTYDVAIVGAGPSGLTAGIYCARGRRSTVVLERNMAGGQIALTELVENYPGFPDGISGFDLADRMKRQAAQFGAELREITTVASLQPHEDGCFSITTDQESIRSRAVILSPGVEAKRSGIPGEAEFIGRGVSWCATCDGALYKGRTVAVVGGGDAAVEEGLFLTKFADKVYVVHRRDELRAAKIAQERAFANPKMEFVWDSVPRRVVGDQMVEGLEVQNLKTKEVRTLPVNGVFFYIGQIPNTAFLQGVVERDEAGYILTDELMRTSLCGVFACGDARSNPLKQIAMAVGEGALAAVQAQRYLDQLECPLPAAGGQRPAWGGPTVPAASGERPGSGGAGDTPTP